MDKRLLYILALVLALLAVGISVAGGTSTQADAPAALLTGGQSQTQPDKIKDMPEYMKARHGLYDNALTALYENFLSGGRGASPPSGGKGTGAGPGMLGGANSPFAPL